VADSPLTIVGIGASAGGLDAFHSFFDCMPGDSGMAFIVVLHLPADHKSLLADILGRWTPMRVLEGRDGATIQPNCVYVPPPHAIAGVREGLLVVRLPTGDDARHYRPIDSLFDALASEQREQAVGIVLSGTGSDGALGLKAIKACGGLTIAQGSDGSSPQYGEMPAGAIATGSVDLVAPIEDIPGHLLRLRGRDVPAPIAAEHEVTDALRLRICSLIQSQLGHDFSGYRDKTFLRRVQRRMQVVNAASMEEYYARLQQDPREVVLLFRDLLIRVTSFFRDKETFEILETLVMPRLFAGKDANDTVRIWVPGCATGEEAYSLAILLREQMEHLRGVPKVQLFATDIDEAAIATARLGTYPPSLLEGLSGERRARFFRASTGGYVVSKEIRDICTFSSHNLLRDPPFSRIDLVSCRNLLIYMATNLQSQVIPVFHYSLVPRGVLLLGASESASRHEALFDPLDKAARIFQKRDVASPPLTVSSQSVDLSLQRLYASASPAAKSASNPVHRDEAPSPKPMGNSNSTLGADYVTPAFKSQWQRFLQLITFTSPSEDVTHDLLSTREKLQSLAEEHQTALEELRSANEELQSVNEEMQSSNEELQTSKEELQSINEELNTVNIRLSEKVDELDKSNSDLRNLFESTEIATIFLDRHFIIRSFTPAIASLYNLIPSDQGRPLTDIATRLRFDRLREDVNSVLETLQPLERRIERQDRAAHYIMRVLPYREPDNSVSGVLITFTDVTSIVQAEAALLDADVRKDVFLATLSHELRNPLAPIRTAARLLNAPGIAPEHLARVQSIIARQVAHMSSLLDDLLDVSRITRGAFLLKKDYVDVQSVLDAAVEAARPVIDAKDHTLRIERPGAPIVLEADPVRVTQVISNLLTNAAKYTDVGGLITLGARLESNGLLIFVRDNGIGLTTEAMTKIFDMFTRVESDTGRAEGGLGIGLALSKGLVELHGGRIEVRSQGPGRGSEFVVCLPLSLVARNLDQRPRSQRVEATDTVSRRVLVADDNRDGAESLEMVLKMLGHEVYIAFDGTEALELARRHRPDVGVIDVGMPDITGYEVARRIRAEAWGSATTLIALTGWGQEEDKRRALAAGFDHHLTKPVDPDQLQQMLVS
jgi:two-component system, chemotaxis family, CheB/CheR fusion protein